MKAIVCHNYGPPDILKCEEIAKPTPGDDEVLIKVRAASVNPVDRLFEGTSYPVRLMTGLRKPKETRVGTDVCGLVEAVGKNVTQFKLGDEVFGACRGAFAEYARAQESKLALKPANVTFEQAASVPVAALTALQGLRDKGKLRSGQKVLINGAAGGVGTFAVQIAKALGAEVTGVCSTRNVEMVRSIGASHVIDYTQEDFTKSSQRYDLIFDCISNHSLKAYVHILNPNGVVVIVGAKGLGALLSSTVTALVLARFVSQRFVIFIAKISREDLAFIGELMASGEVTPVIDRCYKLNEIADAIQHLETGHARGKIVISIDHTNLS